MRQSVSSTAPRRGFKEVVRKFFVSLKRSPHNIAMFVMLVTFIFYSLNLTSISNTTAAVSMDNMGQCEFLTMLLGILAFVSFLRSFPRREKPKFVMIGLTVLMLAISVFADIIYSLRINTALTRADSPIVIVPEKNGFITTAQTIVSVHIILLIVCIALIVALPVYSKLIRKINTSIDVAGNENMVALDMAEDE